MAIVAAVIIRTLFSVTGMMSCRCSVAGGLTGVMCIRGGVGIIAGSATVITVASGVVGASVGLIRMACPSVGNRTVVIGMMTITVRVFVAGHGGSGKCK